ncbi:hypothetical protein OAJ63_00640 [Candidatus Pelagibacter sp.]|nr:hypothetical protein [Candidatus Pelagibacter sp.]|tara:strand:+ start:365 stop:739 length:375 start_codon:yes stop_codon:yes gene_type:complete
MLRILLIILILLPSISNADQGLKISCLNMKSMLGKKYEPLKFTLEAFGLQYFDQEKDKFIMIKASELNIGEDHFTARFKDYELGFRMTLFAGDTEATMTMSKYDFKNKMFLEHYKCDAKISHIE